LRWNSDRSVIRQLRAEPILAIHSIAFPFVTGSAPGSAKQVGHTLTLGSSPKPTLQPQNIFDSVNSST
jgi:hypothetical protein